MNKNIKKIISMVAAVAIIATVGLGAFSYFTDYATSTDKAVAGTFDIDLAHNIDLDGTLNILNPGDVHAFDFTVSNEAQKSADIYAIVTVTGTPASGVTATTDSPYKLLVDGAAAGFADDKEAGVVAGKTDGVDLVYTYTLPIKALNGNEAGAIHETASGANAVNADNFTYEYEIGMDIDALNEWEGSEVDVKIEIFAKQHENTADVGQAAWKAQVEAEINTTDPVDADATAGRIWG